MAYSPEEYMEKSGKDNNFKIDYEWYITQQLMPPI